MTATWSVDVDKRHRKVNFECEKSSYLYDTTLKDLKKKTEKFKHKPMQAPPSVTPIFTEKLR